MTDTEAAGTLRIIKAQLGPNLHMMRGWAEALDHAIGRLDDPPDKVLSEVIAGLRTIGRMVRESEGR